MACRFMDLVAEVDLITVDNAEVLLQIQTIMLLKSFFLSHFPTSLYL